MTLTPDEQALVAAVTRQPSAATTAEVCALLALVQRQAHAVTELKTERNRLRAFCIAIRFSLKQLLDE